MRLTTSLFLAVSLVALPAFAGSFVAPINVTATAPVPGTVQQYPSISMTPSSTFVLWDEDGTRAGRMLANGTMASSVLVDTSVSRDAGVASIGEQSLGVWMQNDWMYAQRFDASGNRTGAPIYLAMLDSRHSMRLGAGGGERYLVAWAIASRLVGSVIAETGELIADQVQISAGTYGRNVETVHVAALRDEFLVVWDTSPDEPWVTPCDIGCATNDREVHIAFVNRDGSVRSEQIVARNAGMPDVASNGKDDYLVVWTGAKSGTVQAAHVTPAGVVSAPMTLVDANAWGPRAVWDGSAYDVAYSLAPNQELHVVRVDAEGRVTSEFGDAAIHTGTWPRQFGIAAYNGKVAVTYVDNDHLVVQYGRIGPVSTRTRAVRH